MPSPSGAPPDAPPALSAAPPAPTLSPEEAAQVEARAAWLRAEAAGAEAKARQARLLGELGDLRERSGDEVAAARDYLGAFNADPTFREPLEALVRLLERRRSLKNLGRVTDALVRAARTPDEKVRALTMSAAVTEEVAHDAEKAKALLVTAVGIDDAQAVERGPATLALELVAAATGDGALRRDALSRRSVGEGDPTWQGLLLIDLARLTAADGKLDEAFNLLQRARDQEAGATWLAALAAERLARGELTTEAVTGVFRAGVDDVRTDEYVAALENQAELILLATSDPAQGDRLGVPHRVRTASHMAEAWLRAAEIRRLVGDPLKAGRILDRALAIAETDTGARRSLVLPAVMRARMRIAELMGQTEIAARLAGARLDEEEDSGTAAALAMRVAEHAAAEGNAERALAALSHAIERDPSCLPARALQLDLLADSGNHAGFASELEAFADKLPTEEAQARAYLLSAFVWGAQAGDVTAAKAALVHAESLGAPQALVARVGRTIASLQMDARWYEETTSKLVAALTTGSVSAAAPGERASLLFDLVRTRFARDDVAGGNAALQDLATTTEGAWIALAVRAFSPGPPSVEGARATEALAAVETDAARARALALVAATQAQRAGNAQLARERLGGLAGADPSDAVVAVYLAALERQAGNVSAAASTLARCATASSDPDLSAALFLEAALLGWRTGDRVAAAQALAHAGEGDPVTAAQAQAWAARGASGAVGAEGRNERRRAVAAAKEAGEDGAATALESFGLEVRADAARARAELDTLREARGDVGVAGALASLLWEPDTRPLDDLRAALTRLAGAGAHGAQLASGEEVRRLRASPGGLADATRLAARWFESGGGLLAAVEWLAASMASGSQEDEVRARRGLAAVMVGPASQALEASAVMVRIARGAAEADSARALAGSSPAVRLVNLELAPAGSDPEARAAALAGVEGSLGPAATLDALSLSGWSYLATGEAREALEVFEEVAEERPDDLAAWEGLREAATQLGDALRRFRAAKALGKLSRDTLRAAGFWEEAGRALTELGRHDEAESAFAEAFRRDATRGYAFDKLFRRVRERRDGERMLELIGRRLEVTDDPPELAKLFWEQARVLREKGNVDGALSALENVTMIEPDHVGALALTGEIYIRRGMYEEAATNLATLATLADAPVKNRLTAGVAAVDLYENKLDRYDRALEVLLQLHGAGLSTLPVRERLARAAARNGAWNEATATLETLMVERPDPAGRMEAARLAIAIWRDRLGKPAGATRALVKLLEESPADGEALDMLHDLPGLDAGTRQQLLGRARDVIVSSLRGGVAEPNAVRRLTRISRMLGDSEMEQLSVGLMLALAGGEPSAEMAMAELAARKPRLPQRALGDAVRALLAPGEEGPLSQLFALLAPTTSEALGPTLAALGVTRKDRIDPKAGLPIQREVLAWAGAFGLQELEIYVGGRDPLGVQGVPGEPHALVLGPGVRVPLDLAARARVAREALALVRGTTVLRAHDAAMVGAVVIAACRLAEVPVQASPNPRLAEIERAIGKAIPRKVKKALPEICRGFVTARQDPHVWMLAAQATHARVLLVASGDLVLSLSETLGEQLDRLRAQLRTDPRALALIKFAFSPTYADVRRALGLGGP